MGAKIFSRRIIDISEGLRIVVEIKDVKRLTMRYSGTDSMIHVSAPPGTSETYLHHFISANRDWALATIKRFTNLAAKKPAPSYDLFLKFHKHLRACLTLRQNEMRLYAKKISVKAMSSRWGSCNPVSGALSFNSRLAFYPEECTDYVVVHELAHLRHANHSSDFWALVAQHCPDHKKWREILRSS